MTRVLSELRISGYRAFDDFRFDDLGQVNLIVGKNNAGKTSVLEAIRLITSGGDPVVFGQIASERSERSGADDYGNVHADAGHFFHGYEFERKSLFAINSKGPMGDLVGEIVDLSKLDADERSGLIDVTPDVLRDAWGIGLRLRLVPPSTAKPSPIIALSDDGHFVIEPTPHRPAGRRYDRTFLGQTIYISAASLTYDVLARLWARILFDATEQDAVQALRVLQADITSVHFLPGELDATTDGILVGLGKRGRRVPLTTMGEGMRRMLALALGLANARRGFLVVDEIDVGLHWSVMSGMWALVAQTARTLGVQVFATTHSLDCLRGLRTAVEANPDIGDAVRVHNIDTRLDHAVTFGAVDLSTAIEQEIEVRG